MGDVPAEQKQSHQPYQQASSDYTSGSRRRIQGQLLGLERKPFPSADGLKNIQQLMKSRNPKMADLKVENLIDASIMHKLEESGFIDELYSTYGIK